MYKWGTFNGFTTSPHDKDSRSAPLVPGPLLHFHKQALDKDTRDEASEDKECTCNIHKKNAITGGQEVDLGHHVCRFTLCSL